MNEFYEAVANFLEELCFDSEERDYAIQPEGLEIAECEQREMDERKDKFQEKLSDMDAKFLEEYLDVLESTNIQREQRAYYQGIMDGIQLLGGMGLIKNNENVKKMIEKFQH
ncbi:MAG: hypothetical protein Q4B70_12945 [Lachnospiraceae bacterium]|nr:hypothetical protein [Lachnospiraceae bacterium]